MKKIKRKLTINNSDKNKKSFFYKIISGKKKEYKNFPFTKYTDIFIFFWYLLGIIFSKLNVLTLTIIFIGGYFKESIATKTNLFIYLSILFVLIFFTV